VPNDRSSAGRRILLNRLYAAYAYDLNFMHLRERVVKGAGPTYPKLMFVGEAPGENEAKKGIPFIGASGQFLNELLGSVGLDRSEVFITNCVKLRPPGNRDPTDKERHDSIPYLRKEHDILGRPPIVMLGKHARKATALLRRGTVIGEDMVVGEWIWMEARGGGYPMLPLHHPAYGIYQRANRPMMFEQFKAVLQADEVIRKHAG
jgi:uracil-DNA glycosylase